jgi:HSP20 family protein
MNLVPWRNKQENGGGVRNLSPINSFRDEMDRLFDTFFRDPFGAMESSWHDRWMPAVDVAENDKELTVRAELPGIDPKELDISVAGNQLIISGEKKESKEHNGKNFYQSETHYGMFRRVVALPEDVDTEDVDAQYSNGVLTLRLTKTAPAPHKRIEVKTT